MSKQNPNLAENRKMKFSVKVKLQHSNQLLGRLLSTVYSAEVKIN